MKGTMLITGRETPLGAALIEGAIAAEHSVVATSDGAPRKRPRRGKEREEKETGERLLLVPWTRQSALSARNVVLRGLSTFDSIDEAVIVHSATRESRPLHELTVATIQQGVDVLIKSELFLIREVLHYFMRKGGGVLSLVLNTEGDEALSTMDSAAAASFAAIIKTVMNTYQNEPVTINGFETASADSGEYASFILSSLAEGSTAGRLYRFGDRSGFRHFSFRKK